MAMTMRMDAGRMRSRLLLLHLHHVELAPALGKTTSTRPTTAALQNYFSILEKIRKKNQPIWSSYEEEKHFTSFNLRKKEKSVLLHEHVTNWNELIDFFFFSSD
jgi:hypothetical protein